MSFSTKTALACIDSYKLGHADQYPPNTTRVYSNFTARSVNHLNVGHKYKTEYIVWAGIQNFLKELKELWDETFFLRNKEEVVAEFAELVAPFVGPRGFNVSRIEWLHDLGYLPLQIKALPEGTVVPVGVPVLTITNTLPEAYWLPNFLETHLSADLWKIPTSATLSAYYRRIIEEYAELTGGSKEFITWQGHDFSIRGMSGIEDAARSGFGHLLSFGGTDNIPAVVLVNKRYHGKSCFVGGSVPATEHSVICAGSKEGELETFRRLLKTYPSGIVSIVSDTWDFWRVITEYTKELKQEILSRTPDQFGNAKVVFRPDSGDPVKILCGYKVANVKSVYDTYGMMEAENQGCEVVYAEDDEAYYKFESYDDGWSTSYEVEEISEHEVKGAVQLLWEEFGGTINAQGYKTLNPHVGLIYGDSITPTRCDQILRELMEKGFASDNVVFGIGSYTFQYTTRDTLGFAMKATYVEEFGKGQSIFKDPVTDGGTKKSARGLLCVVEGEDGYPKLLQDVTPEQEKTGLLRTVFRNGELLVDESIDLIRARLALNPLPYKFPAGS